MQAHLDFPLYSFELSPTGQLRHAGASWEKLLGYTASECKNLPFTHWLSLPEALHKRLEKGEPLTIESEALCLPAQGGSLAVQVVLHSEPAGYRGYLLPNPTLTRQQRHIEQLEARLNAIYQTGNQSIIILDTRHCILDFNQTAEATSQLRFQRKMQPGEDFIHYVQPDRYDDFYESFEQALQGRHVFKERLIYAPDGQGMTYEMLYTPIYDNRGEISSICFMMVNVEQQRQIRLLLNQEQSFGNSILNATNALIVVMDPQGHIVRFNKACERITGYRAEEVREQVLWEMLTVSEERQRVQQIYENISHQNLNNIQYHLRDNQGELHLISWSLSVMQGLQEDTLYIVSTGIDVTERLAAQQALQESEALLRQAQKMEAVGQLAGGIAHDFNNMLTAIVGYGQLLQQEVHERPQAKAYLNEILRTCRKAHQLTSQLLMFSRKAPVESEAVEVNSLLRDIEGLLRGLLQERILLDLQLDPETGWLQGNALHLEQVLMNLVVNARDAMNTTGTLTIQTQLTELESALAHPIFGLFPAGAYVTISVSDTGCGMSPSVQEHIFDPFFTTKEKGKGTGLGLAVVYRIVKEAGGFVKVHSKPGQGSRFTLYFPRVAGLASSPKHQARVLLYQLDEDKGQRMVHSLNSIGCDVLLTQQRTEMQHWLATQTWPALLVAPLPLAAQEDYRASLLEHPQLKILYLSGDSSQEMALLDQLSLREDVLVKPFSLQQLRYRIQRMLGQT
ncbi:MAG: PAS domain-containing sensor histidine kinase [Candidatus Sericytochromatia bacterium]